MNLLIDNRMRLCEKEKLTSLGCKLIELPCSKNVYSEISAHTDIFTCKLVNKIIVEPSIFKLIKDNTNYEVILGNTEVTSKYPYDISYNVCVVGNYAIHNFKYTDNKILQELKKYKIINVNQGYTNCSIAVIDNNSVIISDKGIFEKLKNTDLDILFLDYRLDIKLLNEKCEYSEKQGFIGGCISRIGDCVFISGDLNKIDKTGKIRSFIEKRNLKIIDFKGMDIIDYGGILKL